MPKSDVILDVPDLEIERAEGGTPLVLHVRCTAAPRCPACGHCGAHRKKDTRQRRVQHTSVGHRHMWLVVTVHKWRCPCGRYFHTRLPGILPHQRITEAFRTEVTDKHEHGISLSHLRERYRRSWSTMERWVHRVLAKKVSHQQGRPAPRVLGIDEHFFSRKHGFATTLVDLQTHRVFDVVQGRSEAALRPYLTRLAGKERTAVVLMDLAESYRSLVRQHFPRALIVADRFHVIRLVNHAMLDSWRQLDPVGRRHRGLVSLLRRHPENLRDEAQRQRLADYLAAHPLLEALYHKKQALMTLLRRKHQSARQCRQLAPRFLAIVQELRAAPMAPLRTLGDTLWSWRAEIARMWRFTKTNSITEGLHNKMELISRRAYGFRNFQNYRLRVRALCG